jgi:uncharacterized protein YggE
MNDRKLRNIYSGLLGLVVLTIITGTSSAYFTELYTPGTPGIESVQTQVNKIMVSGTGTVTMPPDEAIVYLGVETRSENAVTAQQSNAEKMEQIIAALKKARVGTDDMETMGYNMYPIREYYDMYTVSEKPDEQGIKGFVVSNQLKVTIKDIDKVGEIIDIAVEAGVNQVNGISFTLSEQTQLNAREQALKNAVIAAREDADILAGALGVKIIDVVEASTSGGIFVSPAPMIGYAVAGSAIRTPIEPGDVSVSAYVTITYQFV